MNNRGFVFAPFTGIACVIGVSLAITIAFHIIKAPQATVDDGMSLVELHKALPHNKLPRLTLTNDEYLCSVYERTPVKRDGTGDFTWKDRAAASRLGMDVCTYAIGGLAPEMKVRLVAFGKSADERGIRWSMLSAFRDDYRQSIASGFKARVGNSRHGGSRATKGYGDGRAIDIAADGPIKPILALIDSIGGNLGLTRPMKRADPNHVQLASSSPATIQGARGKRANHQRSQGERRYAKHFNKHRVYRA